VTNAGAVWVRAGGVALVGVAVVLDAGAEVVVLVVVVAVVVSVVVAVDVEVAVAVVVARVLDERVRVRVVCVRVREAVVRGGWLVRVCDAGAVDVAPGVETAGVVVATVGVLAEWPPPPQAPSASPATAARSRVVAWRLGSLIEGCDGCHSQSARATDMLRGDGSESDGP